MRYFLITSEYIGDERRIEVLHSTNDGNDGIDKLIYFSNTYEQLIVEGQCRVLMTTFEQD